MISSDNLIKFLIKKENCKLHQYKDIVGLLTIGIGHLITAEEKKSGSIYNIPYVNGITEEQAKYIKKLDLEKMEYFVNKYVNDNISLKQHEFDALVSLCFNIGPGSLKNSTLLRRLNSDHDRNLIANEFLKWNKARVNGVLRPVKGLTIRRNEERNMFLNGIY